MLFRKFYSLFLGLKVLEKIFLLTSVFYALTSFASASEFVRNQIIVGFEENSTEEGIGIIEDKIGLKMIKSIDRLDLALFSYDDNRTIEEIVSRCLLLEIVEFAEINSIVTFEGYGGVDPQFSNQWYLKGILELIGKRRWRFGCLSKMFRLQLWIVG